MRRLSDRCTGSVRSFIFLGIWLATLAAGKPGHCESADSLPSAPPGTRVQAIADFEADDQAPVRLAAHPQTGQLFVLGDGGDVYRIDSAEGPKAEGKKTVLFRGDDYIEQPDRQELNIPLPVDSQWVNSPITLRATLCLGLTFDDQGRLYVVANVQTPGKIMINRVDIYRTTIGRNGALNEPKLWTRFDYPYGVGGFNHGACRIAQGPDGLIYLGSGSRTDHGEAGDLEGVSTLGEGPHPDVPGGPDFEGGDFTASILRFDPKQDQQPPEVFSRGNRNPFGFDWDDAGRLIDAEHGPMADHPEELNHVEQGNHYGFPYVFGDNERPQYEDRVEAPAGLEIRRPIKNLGPGGILGVNAMYSLSPHAAPGGMVFYRTGELPKQYEKSFFLARFGNLVNYNRIGFDVLNIRLEETDGELTARTERFLDGLGRPIDVCVASGKLYVLEYCRQTETVGPRSAGYEDGGRLLEISAAAEPAKKKASTRTKAEPNKRPK